MMNGRVALHGVGIIINICGLILLVLVLVRLLLWLNLVLRNHSVRIVIRVN